MVYYHGDGSIEEAILMAVLNEKSSIDVLTRLCGADGIDAEDGLR